MRLFAVFLIFLASFFVTVTYGQTVGKQLEFNSAMGIRYESNLVKNPSAYKNSQHVTVSALASASRDVDAADQIDGKASWLIQSTLITNNVEFELLTPSSEHTSGNCGFAGIFKGQAAAWSAQIQDGSNNTLAKTVFTNESGWRAFVLWHPCGAAGTRKVRIVNSEAGTINPVNVGRLYYGRMEPGAGVPPNTFTAKVSATGVVTDETGGDWISGNCTNASPRVCTLVSPTSSTMNCLFNASSGPRPPAVLSTNTVLNINTYDLTGSPSQVDGQITCTKTGSDYIQPAITPNQWNYGRTLYTPTFGAGFGTVTSPECYHSRDGEFLYVDCKFTTGTVSGSAANVSLPPGLSAVTNTTGTKSVGTWFRSASGTTHGGSVLIGSGSTVISFSGRGVFGSDAVAALTAGVGTEIVGSTEALHFTAKIPIAGWTENQSAPQLVGSVTNKGGTATKAMTEGTFNCSGSSSITSQDDTTFTAIGNIDGVGQCAVSMSGWNATPRCYPKLRSCTAPSGASCFLSQQNVTITSGNVTPRCISDTGANCTSFQFDMLCSGPR